MCVLNAQPGNKNRNNKSHQYVSSNKKNSKFKNKKVTDTEKNEEYKDGSSVHVEKVDRVEKLKYPNEQEAIQQNVDVRTFSAYLKFWIFVPFFVKC